MLELKDTLYNLTRPRHLLNLHGTVVLANDRLLFREISDTLEGQI